MQACFVLDRGECIYIYCVALRGFGDILCVIWCVQRGIFVVCFLTAVEESHLRCAFGSDDATSLHLGVIYQ